jgi:hypothetical protein
VATISLLSLACTITLDVTVVEALALGVHALTGGGFLLLTIALLELLFLV